MNPLLAFGGAVAALVAAILAMVAYNWLLAERAHSAEVALRADPRAKGAPAAESSMKAIALALASGLLFAVFFPVLAARGKNPSAG